MRQRIPIALIAAALAAGCIDVDQTVTLRPDGSGTLDVVYAVPERTVTQLAGMLNLRERLVAAEGQTEDPGQPDLLTRLLLCPNEEAIRGLLGPYQRQGVAIEALEFDNRNTSRNVKLKLSFGALSTLAGLDLFAERKLSLARTESGDYRLSIDMPGAAATEAVVPIVPDSELAKQLQPLLGGFRVVFRIRPPSDILQSSATRKTAQSATWTYEFDRDPRSLAALQLEPITVTFKGDGLSLPEIK
jgi:hypothetical protein